MSPYKGEYCSESTGNANPNASLSKILLWSIFKTSGFIALKPLSSSWFNTN